jgi:cytochrome P450
VSNTHLDEMNRSPYAALAALRNSGDVQPGEIMTLLNTDLPMSTGLDAVEGQAFSVLGFEAARALMLDNSSFGSHSYALTIGQFFGRTILEMDGKEHKAYRRIISDAFSKRAMMDWDFTVIVPTINDLIDEWDQNGSVDLVSELTFPLPNRVIGKLLGLPAADVDWFQHSASAMANLEGDSGPESEVERERATAEISQYFRDVVAEKRRLPQADVISMLIGGEVDGQSLNDEEIVSFLRLLLPAGAETIYRASGSMLLGLLTHPEQLDLVRNDRGLVSAVVEETLRWEPPIMAIGRTATSQVELGGVTIPAGSPVHISLGAANHDERVFPQPEEFDMARPPHPHLAFATGAHTCLGLQLARVEMAAICNVVLDRLVGVEISPEITDVHVGGIAFRSPPTVPVVWNGLRPRR